MSQGQDSGERLGLSERDASADELLRLRAEIEALRALHPRRRANRGWLAGFLVVLTVVAIAASTLAIWIRETVYDTERFMEVVEPALDDPAFYSALGAQVADASLDALDLDARIAALLEQIDVYLSEALVDAIDPDPRLLARLQAFDRPTLAALAPSMSGALEARVVAVVDRFITSDEFRTRLPDLVQRAHTGGVALITDDLAALENVYVEAGEVRLDLTPVIVEALQEVTTDVQVAARQADRLVWTITLLALVLLASAIAVSPDRRRTLVQLALGVVASLVVVMLLARRFEAALLEQITDPDGNQAVRSLLQEITTNLRTVTVLLAVVALTVAIAAHLAGHPAWITSLGKRWSALTAPNDAGSRLDRWIAARFDVLRIAGISVALGVIVLTGLELLPTLLIGGLLVLHLTTIAAARQRIATLEPASPAN